MVALDKARVRGEALLAEYGGMFCSSPGVKATACHLGRVIKSALFLARLGLNSTLPVKILACSWMGVMCHPS
eukprot:5493716-Pyramimonas_sp.AAC.1